MFKIGTLVRYKTGIPHLDPGLWGMRLKVIGESIFSDAVKCEVLETRTSDVSTAHVGSGMDCSMEYLELAEPREPYTSNELGDFPKRGDSHV